MEGSPGHLITGLRRGDPLAARELLDRYGDMMFTAAFRIAGDPDDAKDIVQEALVRVLRRHDTFRGGDLGAWLRVIVVRTALNLRRQARSRKERSGQYLQRQPDSARPRGDPLLQTALSRAIAALPETLRVVVTLVDIDGWSHGDVASALSITPEASRARLHRAREQLRSRLELLNRSTS